MIIYSKKIIQFIEHVKKSIKEILSTEIGLKVYGNRFFDKSKSFSYPISVVIYNNKSILGYFDPEFYELGFHQCWMNESKTKLLNVIRHELAHYLVHITHGSTPTPHGEIFKAFCFNMGWDLEVSKASICLEGEKSVFTEGENGIFRKVKKLMALAASSNQSEAEQAMIKSQHLLLKHNIDPKHIENESEERFCLTRILRQKKLNTKLRSIAKILESFFVNVIFHKGVGCIYLEILGNASNIEIAEYVGDFLNLEFEKLWKVAKLTSGIKGQLAKNSFFLGIAKGYCNKIDALKKCYTDDIAHALTVIDKKLQDASLMAYPRLSSTKSHSRYCNKSSLLGQQMGNQLSINPSIKSSSKNTKTLLSFK